MSNLHWWFVPESRSQAALKSLYSGGPDVLRKKEAYEPYETNTPKWLVEVCHKIIKEGELIPFKISDELRWVKTDERGRLMRWFDEKTQGTDWSRDHLNSIYSWMSCGSSEILKDDYGGWLWKLQDVLDRSERAPSLGIWSRFVVPMPTEIRGVYMRTIFGLRALRVESRKPTPRWTGSYHKFSLNRLITTTKPDPYVLRDEVSWVYKPADKYPYKGSAKQMIRRAKQPNIQRYRKIP